MEESTYYWLEAFVIIFGIAIIVVGVWYHINYGKFKPKIEVFSDGLARMIFFGVSERCKKQMVRFNAEYQVGHTVTFNGNNYVIEEIKPIDAFDVKYLGQRHGLACYLKQL